MASYDAYSKIPRDKLSEIIKHNQISVFVCMYLYVHKPMLKFWNWNLIILDRMLIKCHVCIMFHTSYIPISMECLYKTHFIRINHIFVKSHYFLICPAVEIFYKLQKMLKISFFIIIFCFVIQIYKIFVLLKYIVEFFVYLIIYTISKTLRRI